jgi:hypothetical protein
MVSLDVSVTRMVPAACVNASSLPLFAGCHGPFCHCPHALYAACRHLLPHISARCAHLHSHPAAPPWFFLGACPFDALLGGPHRSVHAKSVRSREHTLSASRTAGGESPLLKVQRVAAHPRTNPAARAARGEPPPSALKAPLAQRAPRKCRSSSGPGGHTPLSQPHMRGTVLGTSRSMPCCLGPASGSAHVPDALPAGAHTLTH